MNNLKRMGYRLQGKVWVKPVAFSIFIIFQRDNKWFIAQRGMSASDNTTFDWKEDSIDISNIRSIQGAEAYVGRNMYYWSANHQTDKLVPELSMQELLQDMM